MKSLKTFYHQLYCWQIFTFFSQNSKNFGWMKISHFRWILIFTIMLLVWINFLHEFYRVSNLCEPNEFTQPRNVIQSRFFPISSQHFNVKLMQTFIFWVRTWRVWSDFFALDFSRVGKNFVIYKIYLMYIRHLSDRKLPVLSKLQLNVTCLSLKLFWDNIG